MEYTFSTAGALIGLVIAIILIIKKIHPAYSLILGALVGGIIGGVKASIEYADSNNFSLSLVPSFSRLLLPKGTERHKLF